MTAGITAMRRGERFTATSAATRRSRILRRRASYAEAGQRLPLAANQLRGIRANGCERWTSQAAPSHAAAGGSFRPGAADGRAIFGVVVASCRPLLRPPSGLGVVLTWPRPIHARVGTGRACRWCSTTGQPVLRALVACPLKGPQRGFDPRRGHPVNDQLCPVLVGVPAVE
jgi:hypothetical protein